MDSQFNMIDDRYIDTWRGGLREHSVILWRSFRNHIEGDAKCVEFLRGQLSTLSHPIRQNIGGCR